MARSNLTLAAALVLHCIDAGFRYGFDIMDASGLPDGTVYPALRRLEAAGFLAAEWENDEQARADGRPARRYYALTPAGRKRLAEGRARFAALSAIPSGRPRNA